MARGEDTYDSADYGAARLKLRLILYPRLHPQSRKSVLVAGGGGTTCSPQLEQTTGVSRHKRAAVRLR
jgi:hypothetical protein